MRIEFDRIRIDAPSPPKGTLTANSSGTAVLMSVDILKSIAGSANPADEIGALLTAMARQRDREVAAATVTVRFERRDDGGLRAWSDDVPGLVLSNRDPHRVLDDVIPALRVLLGHVHGSVDVRQLAGTIPTERQYAAFAA